MIEAGTTISWIHPQTNEVYYFPVKEAEHHGCGHWTITLQDGRKTEIWEYELAPDEPYEITEDQVNVGIDPNLYVGD